MNVSLLFPHLFPLDSLHADSQTRMVQADGLQTVRRWLNAETGGNAARMLKRFANVLPGSNHDSITVERIFETYRESIGRQLGS
jgi:hypothetical protein